MKACDEQAALIIQRCSPTAAQKPAAAEGNTMRVRGHICVYRSLLSVTEDRQSWGCGRIYPDYTAPSPTATRKANPLSAVLFSQFVVLAAASCNSVVTTHACCDRLPIHVPDHHHAASLLFGQRCRDCFWYVVIAPILNFVCNRCITTVHRFFCYRQQQQQHTIITY